MTKLTIEIQFRKAAGFCLLLCSFLATLGIETQSIRVDIQYIVKTTSVFIFSHSTAIFCMPLISFGFGGLTQILQTKSKLSTLAFIIFSFGFFTAMIAATINGLTLPNFASTYTTNENDTSTVRKIIDYGRFINVSMATIFIFATAIAICIWSVLIIQAKQISKELGYFGLTIIAFGLIGTFLKFNFTDLFGFRTFIFF